jgi:hypothetical protein
MSYSKRASLRPISLGKRPSLASFSICASYAFMSGLLILGNSGAEVESGQSGQGFLTSFFLRKNTWVQFYKDLGFAVRIVRGLKPKPHPASLVAIFMGQMHFFGA